MTTMNNYSREVRLGIVMYGGVSLAVYENGVAQELFRAVHGEGVYALVKKLIGSDIIVDIMSGTSAGGINGVLLGYALANKLDFRTSANLWRNDGDILKLLRPPNAQHPASLLDSRGYYQPRLESAFQSMPGYVSRDGDGSEVDELDVFVTGTDAEGEIHTEFDDDGHAIDIKNHHKVFMLSFRRDRKNEFHPRNFASLAKLCRITSCFPVAFEPVHITADGPESLPEDGLIRRWGSLTHESFFLDGGVLNNKPFTSAIDAIHRRTADRDVTRFLFYVEPDPERFEQLKKPASPNVVQAATDALVSIPGYQSIAMDLQAVADHNDRVKRHLELRGCIDVKEPVTACLDMDEAKALETLLDDPVRLCVYAKARLGQLRDRAVTGLISERAAQNGSLSRVPYRRGDARAIAEHLVENFARLFEQINPKISRDQIPGMLQPLVDYDVYFRLRRLFHLTYRIKHLLYDAADGTRPAGPQADQYRELWARINHQIKLLEMIQFAMESGVEQAPILNEKLERGGADIASRSWQAVQNILRLVLDTDGVPAMTVVAAGDKVRSDERLVRLRVMDALRDRLDRISTNTGETAPVVAGNLLHATDALEREVLRLCAPLGEDDPIVREYCRFLTIDSYLFPMEWLSSLESWDVIHTVRISPVDAKRGYSNRSLDAKLCGTELGHFGGFLKRSWRANDLLWGRLDGACQLIETLMEPERLAQVSRAADDDDLAAAFPNAAPQNRLKLKRFFDDLAAGRAAGQDYEDGIDLLVSAAQQEILEEEAPQVVRAAITQEVEWNEYTLGGKAESPYDAHEKVWKTGVSKIDRTLLKYASDQIGRNSKPQGGWDIEDVTVGDENWRTGLPLQVLLEIMARALLVLRSCLLAIPDARVAARIRGSLLFKVFFDWPVRLLYRFLSFQREAPEWALTVLPAACVASAIVLAGQAGGLYLKVLFYRNSSVTGGSFQLLSLLEWVAVPACVFLISLWLLLSRTRKRRQTV
jgi:patatin-related protein